MQLLWKRNENRQHSAQLDFTIATAPWWLCPSHSSWLEWEYLLQFSCPCVTTVCGGGGRQLIHRKEVDHKKLYLSRCGWEISHASVLNLNAKILGFKLRYRDKTSRGGVSILCTWKRCELLCSAEGWLQYVVDHFQRWLEQYLPSYATLLWQSAILPPKGGIFSLPVNSGRVLGLI